MVRAAVGISVVAMVMFSVFGASSSEPSSERIEAPPQAMTAVSAKKAPAANRPTGDDAGTLALLTVLMLSGGDPAEAAGSIVAASE